MLRIMVLMGNGEVGLAELRDGELRLIELCDDPMTRARKDAEKIIMKENSKLAKLNRCTCDWCNG